MAVVETPPSSLLNSYLAPPAVSAPPVAVHRNTNQSELTPQEVESIRQSMDPKSFTWTVFENTLPGLAARAIARGIVGEDYMEPPEAKLGYWEKKAASLGSFAADPTNLLLRGSGKMVAETVVQQIGKRGAKQMLGEKALPAAVTRAIESGTFLGAHAAAGKALTEVRQTGTIDPMTVLSEGLRNAIVGSTLGPTGTLGKAALGGDIAAFAVAEPFSRGEPPSVESVIDATFAIGGIKAIGLSYRGVVKLAELGQRTAVTRQEYADATGQDARSVPESESERVKIVNAAVEAMQNAADVPPPPVPKALAETGPITPEAKMAAVSMLSPEARAAIVADHDQRVAAGQKDPTPSKAAMRAAGVPEEIADRTRAVRAAAVEQAKQEIENARNVDAKNEARQDAENVAVEAQGEAPQAPQGQVNDVLGQRKTPFPTGMKNAIVDQERNARGLPPMMEPLRRAWPEVHDEAMRQIDEQPTRQDALIAELADKPRALKDTEQVLLFHRRVTLNHERNKALDDLEAARSAGDVARTAELEQSEQYLSSELSRLEEVHKKSGSTAVARSLNIRRMLANEDFSLAKLLQEERVSKGRPLTPDEALATRSIQRDAEKKQRQYELALGQAEEAKAPVPLTFEQVVAAVKAASPRERMTEQPQPVKVVENLRELQSFARKLERWFVEQGVQERDPNVAAVHAELRSIVSDVTIRQTRDILSGYGQYRQLPQDAISAIVRDLHGQEQQVSKLEDMASGKAPRKTGQERRTPTDAERTLIKLVNEAKRKGDYVVTDPDRQLKTTVDAIETALRHQVADLESQIAKGERIIKVKTAPRTNERIEALRAKRDELKAQLDVIAPKARMTDAERLARYKKFLLGRQQFWQNRLDRRDFTPRKQEIRKLDKEAESLRFDIEQIKRKWREVREKDRLARRTKLQKAAAIGADVLFNVTRSIMLGPDLSYVMMQGGPWVFGHPIKASEAFVKSLRSWVSDAGQSQEMHRISQRPLAKSGFYQRSNLQFTDPHGHLGRQEEAVASTLADHIPLIRRFGRSMSTFLNVVRADMMDEMVRNFQGPNGLTDAQGKVLANMANVATGRVPFGRMEGAVIAANHVFMAPRWVASRFMYELGQPLWKGDHYTRTIIAREYARSLAGLATVVGVSALGLTAAFGPPGEDNYWDIGWNPVKPNFGLRIGTTRIDPFWGLRSVTTMVVGIPTSIMSKAISGETGVWGFEDAPRRLWKFVQYKFAPVPGAVVAYLDKELPDGRPATALNIGGQLLTPISSRQIYEGLTHDGMPVERALALTNILGINSQLEHMDPDEIRRTLNRQTERQVGESVERYRRRRDALQSKKAMARRLREAG